MEPAGNNNAINTSGATIQDGTAGASGDQATNQQAKGPLELDTQERFRFQGHDYTPEELSAAILRQSDYTQKTQALASEKKFNDALTVDLRRVKDDPGLASQFRAVYPEKYHAYLDLILNQAEADESGDDSYDEVKLPKAVMDKLKKLDEIERRLGDLDALKQESMDRELSAADKHLDTIFTKFSEKYPYAVDDTVMARAEVLLKQNEKNPNFKMTEAVWERLFKQSDAQWRGKWEKQYSSQMQDQLTKSKNASDVAPGGSAPGREPKKMSFAEATEMMIQDLKGAGAR